MVVALSYSGETEEILRLLETIRRLGAKLDRDHRRARHRRWRRPPTSRSTAASTEEACPMNLVPTASTTAALAIGDALAMTLLVAKGSSEEDFANLHPGGKLGKRLMRVESADARRQALPDRARRHADARRDLRDVAQGLGMTCVVDGDDALLGIITDGDLRRRMERAPRSLELTAARRHDARPGHDRAAHMLAAEALNIMEQRKITSLVVVEATSAARRRRRAPARSVAHGAGLSRAV